MAKEPRPAMPFYGRDFYDDLSVQEMDLAEQGAYLRLIWLCWSEGAIPDDAERIARILKVPETAAFIEKSFGKLRACFDSVDGTLVHGKIERIRAEFESFRKAKSEAGKKGAEARWQSHDSVNGKVDGKR
jgi:uncharacterized protein YdaU (DUF1376 family)